MSEFGKGIPLASGFDLGAKKPLDSRDVVDTIEERNSHVTENRAYEGMTVYVKEDKTVYRYDGNNWIDLSNYYTKEETERQINNLQTELDNKLEISDLNNYAKKVDIPTKTSELTNDNGFISEIPNEYVTEDELNNTIEKYYTKNEVDEKIKDNGNNNETIQNLLNIIESLQSQIQQLQEDVEYLKTHGGGGTIPDDDENEDIVNDGVLILENGFELLLEDGSSILLEGNADGGDDKEEEKDNIILLENGFELLLEDGSNFLLDVA